MKYTPATVAKAITSGVTTAIATAAASAGGTDLSVLTAPQWIGVLGAGLVAFGAVFATPNKSHAPEPEPATPGDLVTKNLPVVVENAVAGYSELKRVQEATAEAFRRVPGIGPVGGLVADTIESVKIPKL